MPLYRFAGPTSYYFPASRDALGVPLGDVNPGDERDLDEPVGQWWVPADGQDEPPVSDEDRARAAMAAAAETPPDGPVPAPPAVIP